MREPYLQLARAKWNDTLAAAGFLPQDRKSANVLAGALVAAYVVALALSLLGTLVPANQPTASAEPITLDELTQAYRKAASSSRKISPAIPRVPTLFLDRFPTDYGMTGDIAQTKQHFVQVVLPLILAENRRVRRQRASIEGLLARTRSGLSLRPSQHEFLRDLAVLYRAAGLEADELSNRVDAVPPSLALAQAAEESSWGRSRFAREGNALFGQWTYDRSRGLVPRRRPENAQHLVRKFAGLRASVRAYMINLNTHPSYEEFRRGRSAMRAGYGEALDGYALARRLHNYSERGAAYSASIRAIIRVNRFDRYDRARLTPAQQRS